MEVIAGVMIGAAYLQNVQIIIREGKKLLEQVTVTDKETTTIPVHCNLAASFGTLNKESVKTMDKELKVMIAATMRALGKLTDLKWDTVVACMMQNSLLEPMEGSTITRSDKLIKKGTNVFKIDGSPSQPIVNEVKSWFVMLIQDKDVLDDTKIDIDVLAKMVASTGALITSFETFFAKMLYNERTVIDVGVLRYPDIENPYFKLYRIQLTAWKDCRRILFVQEDANGITGEYQCMRFKPRESVMRQLKSEVLAQAVNEAEALFG